jgi:adenylate kinase
MRAGSGVEPPVSRPIAVYTADPASAGRPEAARAKHTEATVAEKYRTVLLFGAPGAGKGTQGKMLGCVPGFHHFSTGEMFRNLDPHSELGKTFRQYSTRGELVPDELTVQLWLECMQAQWTLGLYHPFSEMLVLDGIPRNVKQTELLKDYVEVLSVIVLDAKNPDEMLNRLRGRALKEGRADDAQESVIRRRLEIYRQDTEPLIACYPKDRVHRIDAIGSPARVLGRVLDALVPVQEAEFSNILS